MNVATSDQKAIEEMSQALESISVPEKQAYLEAKERNPLLFETESHPLKFIQCCAYNVWDAAKRLVSYWHERKQLFGDRAFLPMTQTGDGALSPDDVLVLQAGFPSLIPDSTGNGQILFFDRRRALQASSREARLRCVLYLLTVASEDIRARLNNVFAMVLLITPRVTDFDHEYARRSAQLFNLTACRVSLHCLKCLPKGGKRTLLERVGTIGTNIMSTFGDFQVHAEVEPGQLVMQLRRLGLHPSNIPNCIIGGTWNFESFNLWCRDRVSLERNGIKQMGLPQQATTTGQPAATTSTTAPGSSTPPLPATATGSSGQALPTDKLARKRLLNVMHSRQKRERRKMEMNNLLEEKHTLLKERDRLQRENKWLGEQMKKAREVVQRSESAFGDPALLLRTGMAASTPGRDAVQNPVSLPVAHTTHNSSQAEIQPLAELVQKFQQGSSTAQLPPDIQALLLGSQLNMGGDFSPNQQATDVLQVSQASSLGTSSRLGETALNILSLPAEEQQALMVLLMDEGSEHDDKKNDAEIMARRRQERPQQQQQQQQQQQRTDHDNGITNFLQSLDPLQSQLLLNNLQRAPPVPAARPSNTEDLLALLQHQQNCLLAQQTVQSPHNATLNSDPALMAQMESLRGAGNADATSLLLHQHLAEQVQHTPAAQNNFFNTPAQLAATASTNQSINVEQLLLALQNNQGM